MAELGNIGNLVTSIKELSKLVDKMAKDWQKIEKSSGAVSKSSAGMTKGGQKNNGVAGGVISGSLADFSYVPGSTPTKPQPIVKKGGVRDPAYSYDKQGNAIGPSSPDEYVNQFNTNSRIVNRRRSIAQGVTTFSSFNRFNNMSPEAQDITASGLYGPADSVRLFSGLSNSMATFLPGIENTMNRATGYYNAGVYNTTGRKSVEDATFGTLSKLSGLTSVGSDARIAQYLTSRGMTASGTAGSTYQQTLTGVANAGRYMNISNEEAAASIEGMTSAKGAAETLRNFGIYTADLNTGKEKTQGQIFEELAQRLTAGRGKASVEQTQASMRRGALGVTIESFFKGDEQGAQMFKQYMLDRANGTATDLSSGAPEMAKDNPLAAQMAMNTSDTAQYSKAQNNYIQGVIQATKALQALNNVSGGLAESFAGIPNAVIQSLYGHNTTQGMIHGATTAINFGSKAASSIMEAALSPNIFTAGPIATMIGVSAGASLLGAAAMYAGAGLIGSGGTSYGGGGGFSGAGTGGTTVGGGFSGGGTGGGFFFDLSEMESKGINEAHGTKRGSGYHGGTDYNYGYGEAVKAIADGVVHVEPVRGKKREPGSSSLGNQVVLLHTMGNGETYTSIYGHLSNIPAKLKKGTPVKKGETIGYAGNSGNTTGTGANPGTHLHFELRKGKRTTGYGSGSGSDATWISAKVAHNILPSGSFNDVYAGNMETEKIVNPVVEKDNPERFNEPVGPQNNTETWNKVLGTKGPNMDQQVSLLKGLYSGDTASILNSIKQMGINMGMTAGSFEGYMNNPLAGTNYIPGGSGAGTGSPGSGNTNNNNVSIVVQVPDVTSADAVKFAQLVKQYLDDNSLMSNTGSI
jgi:murein DD-endopeptidase MepM/ murein hydrolase activator NlpD